jgi:DNA polymerase-3 subunit gamma/tau
MSSYIVSARKYRPSVFADVVGQEQVTHTLLNEIKSGHLAQAFLFCGPRGVGKTTCARILAKEINKIDDNEVTDLSFNIFELDAASNNSVDDIRLLTDQVRIPPQTGKYKVYIIDEVHMLSQAAFNAFLKTLEEPPPYAIFILATTEKHKILPTILSRCQIFDFRRIEVPEIVEQLKRIAGSEKITYEERALHIIAQKADGGMRDALSLFDKMMSFSENHVTYQTVIDNLNILDYDYFFKLTDSFLEEDSINILLLFDEIFRKGFEGDTFMNGLAEHFRNLLMCKHPQTTGLLEVSPDIEKQYIEQANIISETFLLNALDIANSCDIGYRTSKNKRLHVELSLLKICFLSSKIKNINQIPSEEIKKKPRELVKEIPITKYAEKPVVPKKLEEEKPIIQLEQSLPNTEEEQGTEEVKVEVSPPKNPELVSTTKANPAFSLDNLFNIKSAVEEVKEAKKEIAITQELLEKIWNDFSDKNSANLPGQFISLAKSLKPILKDENSVVIELENSVSMNILDLGKSQLIEFCTKELNGKSLGFNFIVVKNEEEVAEQIPYTTKGILKKMIEDNPAILDLQKRLDLDISF